MRDDLGEPVRLGAVPRRVVSLVPSLTEAVAATVPGVLAGVTDYCTHPPLDLPRIGGSKYPRVPDVLAAQPDLVLANAEENRPEDVAQLRAAGIPVWVTAAPATVPAALDSLDRFFREVFTADPGWLRQARELWTDLPEQRGTVLVPVWRRPWVVLGRATFAGDVLRRLGFGNVYADHPDRYPRPPLAELLGCGADLVVLPDEPYEFTATDGPEVFPGRRCVLLSGRLLTWYGPSLVPARAELAAAFSA
ncbi:MULTISPECIES: helical backbone metal receptor [unclassified Crossiella]|uniref:helical backbone metal receptor n=1 Tax=unclassified Crossiella TaxID=2620835 RepID=UPI001FFFFD25|nr:MULTISPECIES: helical backbone metal receptor [unclassified Crossiella]MCK2240756.1 helical backbone metal receptor [Crossiella sp. S99.2]MCK2254100.1 helical backbone metal receptor [Crossiella sp. S99.1]